MTSKNKILALIGFCSIPLMAYLAIKSADHSPGDASVKIDSTPPPAKRAATVSAIELLNASPSIAGKPISPSNSEAHPPESIEVEAIALWREAQSIPSGLALTADQYQDGRIFIESDPVNYSKLAVDSIIRFAIPQMGDSQDYRVLSTEPMDGVHLLKASSSSDNFLTIVSNEGFVAGSIKLPSGEQYDFEVNEGVGWIHSTAELTAAGRFPVEQPEDPSLRY